MGILHLHPHLSTGRGTPCQVLVGQRKGRLGIWTTAIHTIELSGSFEATPGSLKAASLGLMCVLTALWNTKGTCHTPGADSPQDPPCPGTSGTRASCSTSAFPMHSPGLAHGRGTHTHMPTPLYGNEPGCPTWAAWVVVEGIYSWAVTTNQALPPGPWCRTTAHRSRQFLAAYYSTYRASRSEKGRQPSCSSLR